MRKFSAHRIYPVSGRPIDFGIIETNDDGTILKIRETGGKPVEEAGLEFHSGIIIPGLVNAHCHLELSHLEGLITQLTGISGFVSEIAGHSAADPERIRSAAYRADRAMYLAGISAAGDISNTGYTLPIKMHSRIRYHTFIEVFGLNADQADERFDRAMRIAGEFSAAGQRLSLSPHAPYSVSAKLWEKISAGQGLNGRISIHHDESQQERDLLEIGQGKLADYLRQSGFDLSVIPEEAPDILGLLGKYVKDSEWILVHNTLTDPFRPAFSGRTGLHWVLCPRSNLFIENRLPDLNGFAGSGLNVCLGTDSLASNHSLSVLDEMKLIMEAAPEIDFETILQWATMNGARALGLDDTAGSLEPGKNPGLVNIPVFGWKENRLTGDSKPVRLI
jgi:aminodeoxyfutalosine deaminase